MGVRKIIPKMKIEEKMKTLVFGDKLVLHKIVPHLQWIPLNTLPSYIKSEVTEDMNDWLTMVSHHDKVQIALF